MRYFYYNKKKMGIKRPNKIDESFFGIFSYKTKYFERLIFWLHYKLEKIRKIKWVIRLVKAAFFFVFLVPSKPLVFSIQNHWNQHI